MIPTSENEDDPRITSWIYDDRVDSQAMLIAYQHWLHNPQGNGQHLGWHCRLHAIVHAGHRSFDMSHSPVPLTRCEADACALCRQNNGHWEFHWYNQAWYATYHFFALPGSWTHEGAHRERRGGQVDSTAPLTMSEESAVAEDGSSSTLPSDGSISEGW